MWGEGRGTRSWGCCCTIGAAASACKNSTTAASQADNEATVNGGSSFKGRLAPCATACSRPRPPRTPLQSRRCGRRLRAQRMVVAGDQLRWCHALCTVTSPATTVAVNSSMQRRPSWHATAATLLCRTHSLRCHHRRCGRQASPRPQHSGQRTCPRQCRSGTCEQERVIRWGGRKGEVSSGGCGRCQDLLMGAQGGSCCGQCCPAGDPVDAGFVVATHMHAAIYIKCSRLNPARRTHSKEKSLWGPCPFQPGQRSRTWSLKQVPLRMASCTAGSSRRLSGAANW